MIWCTFFIHSKWKCFWRVCNQCFFHSFLFLHSLISPETIGQPTQQNVKWHLCCNIRMCWRGHRKSSVARGCVLEEYDHPFLKYLKTVLQKDSLHLYLVQPFASSSHCSGPMHSRRVWYFQIVDHGLPEELNNQMMREAIGNIHLTREVVCEWECVQNWPSYGLERALCHQRLP